MFRFKPGKSNKNQNEAELSRRSFLKKSSALGAAAAAAGSAGSAAQGRPIERREDEYHPNIIIGSGFGGSITALRLTEKGIPALIVEKGKRWANPRFSKKQTFSPNLYPDGRSTWLKNTTVVPLGPALPIRKRTGVLEGHDLAKFRVLNGAAYGGGSITYGGVMVQPDEKVFNQVFPEAIRFNDLKPYYAKVAKKLNRGTIPKDVLESKNYTHNRVMIDHCEKADVKLERIPTATDWDIVREEIDGTIKPSIIEGEAIYGVNSGAKFTTDQTYLAEAEATGLLTVKTLHQVEEIAQNEDGRYVVIVREIDEYGKSVAVQVLTCDSLFLSAGSVGTSKLLVKAKAKGYLPKLNDEVGNGFGNNGNVYALRLGLKENVGSKQAGPPSLGINALDNPNTPLFIEHPQLPVGIDFKGLLYFGIGITPTRGSFYYDEKSDSVKLKWPKKDKGQEIVNKAILSVLDKLNKANGGFVTSILSLFKKKVKDDAVYHALGGCVMGKACDYYGRVKNYKGLYVNDSSFMPGTSACSNPSFTISALAERNIDKIIKEDY